MYEDIEGISLVVEMRGHPPFPPSPQYAAARGLVRRQIKSCTACGLHCGMRDGPVPYQSVTIPPWFGVLGQSPGDKEDEKGIPFIGPAGRLLRAMFGNAGIDSQEVLFMNAVSCWPKGRQGDVPTDSELRACRSNVRNQILLLGDRPFILLVGGTALKVVRPDLKVSKHHGRVFLWQREEGTYTVMPILHPAAILRQRFLKEPTIKDIVRWVEIVEGNINPLDALAEDCIICGAYLTHLDPDGIGYCDEHWLRYGNNWQRARDYWEVKDNAPEQPRLV